MPPGFNAPTIASEADSAAVCRGVLSTLDSFVINQPTPGAWKNAMSVTADKAKSVELAHTLEANLPERLRHDKAEAILLAIYSENSHKKHNP